MEEDQLLANAERVGNHLMTALRKEWATCLAWSSSAVRA